MNPENTVSVKPRNTDLCHVCAQCGIGNMFWQWHGIGKPIGWDWIFTPSKVNPSPRSQLITSEVVGTAEKRDINNATTIWVSCWSRS